MKTRVGIILLGMLLCGIAVVRGEVANPTGFAHYVPIEIGEAYTGNSVSNIQVLVHLDDVRIPGFDVQSSDTNLLFTSIDGYRVYPHEVDTWSTNGDSLVWVRLPVLERGARFRMYYGRDEAPANMHVSSVWEEYNGVWHLNGNYTDSVANAKYLTNSNTVPITSAPIGTGFGTLHPNDGAVFVSDATKYIDEYVN